MRLAARDDCPLEAAEAVEAPGTAVSDDWLLFADAELALAVLVLIAFELIEKASFSVSFLKVCILIKCNEIYTTTKKGESWCFLFS